MSDAIPYETIVERVKDDIDYIAGSAYARGYNTAKSEIALSGEYERAYMRGKKDALHWIPCTERLPEPRIDVWCNSDMGQMVGYYEENVETWYGRDYLELMVTAWMPLPEPWKGGENDA